MLKTKCHQGQRCKQHWLRRQALKKKTGCILLANHIQVLDFCISILKFEQYGRLSLSHLSRKQCPMLNSWDGLPQLMTDDFTYDSINNFSCSLVCWLLVSIVKSCDVLLINIILVKLLINPGDTRIHQTAPQSTWQNYINGNHISKNDFKPHFNNLFEATSHFKPSKARSEADRALLGL